MKYLSPDLFGNEGQLLLPDLDVAAEIMEREFGSAVTINFIVAATSNDESALRIAAGEDFSRLSERNRDIGDFV